MIRPPCSARVWRSARVSRPRRPACSARVSPRSARVSRPRRPGLSLLEVVVSMTILLFSVVALSQLISLGSDRALDVQQQATGTMLAQRKMAEVMIGAVPPSSAGFTAFEDDGMSDWQWKLDVNPGSVGGVFNVQVTVKYSAIEGRDFEIQLGQMILDPSLRGSSLDAPQAQAGDPNASSSDSSSNNSSNASSSPTPAASSPNANKNKTKPAQPAQPAQPPP